MKEKLVDAATSNLGEVVTLLLFPILVGLAAWALAEITEWVKHSKKVNREKKAVDIELQDILSELELREVRILNDYRSFDAQHTSEMLIPNALKTPLLEKFYPDVVFSYTEAQRYNIRLFQHNLEAYQDELEEIRGNHSSLPLKAMLRKLISARTGAARALHSLDAVLKNSPEKLHENHPKVEELKEEAYGLQIERKNDFLS